MKRKFLVLTLCFTLVFSSLNYKRSYADGGVISVPMLATISALAVGSNIIINNSDDLYDIGRMFYDYVDRHNDLTWAAVKSVFASSVALQPNNLVSVKSDFLDIVKNFFDDTFNKPYDLGSYWGVPYVGSVSPSFASVSLDKIKSIGIEVPSSPSSFSVGDYEFVYTKTQYNSSQSANMHYYNIVSNGSVISTITQFEDTSKYGYVYYYYSYLNDTYGISLGRTCLRNGNSYGSLIGRISLSNQFLSGYDFPYDGGYTWDNVADKFNENNELPLPIPGNLDSLVGQNKDTFWDNTDNLVGTGGLTLPGVDSPSIGVDTSINTFPGVDIDVPDIDVPDTNNPSIDKPSNGLDIFPPWGGGIDFTPVTQSSFIDKFPFSLGNDIKNILNIFDVKPIAPKFKVPIVSETIELDLTEFEQLASIIRFFVLIGFIISLILVTRSVIG